MKTELSLRERKFIKAYIENCGNASEAYRTISPKVKKESAWELGSRMLRNVEVSIVEIAEKMGLTDPIIIQKLIDGLSATKETGIGIIKKEITDYTAIAKYIDMSLKLKGKYPSEKHDIKVEGELKVIDARQKLIDKIDSIATRAGKKKTT